MRKILRFIALRVHNVKIQLLIAAMYGMFSIFGIGGTIAILIKLRKQAEQENKANARKTRGRMPGVQHQAGDLRDETRGNGSVSYVRDERSSNL